MTDDPTGYALPVGSYEDARAMVGQRTEVRFGHIDVNEAMVRAFCALVRDPNPSDDVPPPGRRGGGPHDERAVPLRRAGAVVVSEGLDYSQRFWEDVRDGEQLPTVVDDITYRRVIMNAAATWDYFPGHHDPEYARSRVRIEARPRLAWALILNPTARYRGRGDALRITARLERLASLIAEMSDEISGNSGTAARDFCCNPLCYRYRLERRPGRACSTRAWGYPG